MSRESEPLDRRVIQSLVKRADEFETSVASGQDFLAAIAATGLIRELRRFIASEFSHLSLPAAESQPSRLSLTRPGAAGRNPDPGYSKIVRDCTRRFKESISKGDSASALQALIPTGIITSPSPRDELDSIELEAARTSGATRLLFLPSMAKRAYWIGDIDKAAQYASEALRLNAEDASAAQDTDDAVHDGHMVLGLVALKRGDKEEAKQHLLASVRRTGSLEMKMGGPNLTLAAELWNLGEREVVIEYLEGCRSFWRGERGQLRRWIERIRTGEDPEFDIDYFSS